MHLELPTGIKKKAETVELRTWSDEEQANITDLKKQLKDLKAQKKAIEKI